jgi:endonuclease G
MAKIPNRLPASKPLGGQVADLDRKEYEILVDARAEKMGAPAYSQGDPHYDSRLERIILEENFLSVNFLSKGARLADSICRIEMKASGRWLPWGTGFLIAPNLVMTNHHVFEEPAWAENARLLFADELDIDDNPTAYKKVVLKPQELFTADADLDFAICRVEGRPADDYGFIQLDGDLSKVSRHDRVNIIQHPNGRRKEVVLQDNKIERVKKTLLLYRADTQPGSSGSPVFNNGWELVALHHAGGERDPTSKAWCNNEGIRISSIVNHLKESALKKNEHHAVEILEHVVN